MLPFKAPCFWNSVINQSVVNTPGVKGWEAQLGCWLSQHLLFSAVILVQPYSVLKKMRVWNETLQLWATAQMVWGSCLLMQKITPHLQGMFCLSCLDWHLHFRQPSRCRHIGIFKVSLGSYFEVHIFLLTEMKTAQDPWARTVWRLWWGRAWSFC